MKQAFDRSIALFAEVFRAWDEIWLVTYVTSPANSVFLQKNIERLLKIYKAEIDAMFTSV